MCRNPRKRKKMMNRIGKSFAEFADAFATQMRMVCHDAGVVLFFVFLPLAYPVLYSQIYNPELVRNVEVVVVDHDRTPLSREMARRLDATQEVNVLGYASEMGEARRAMASHSCFGIIEIPHGFERKASGGEGAQVIMYSDMSLMLRYRSILLATTNVALDMGAELMSRQINTQMPIAETVSPEEPMRIVSEYSGNPKAGFASYVMPCVLILILHQCLTLAVGMCGGTRHENPLSYVGRTLASLRRHHLARMLGQMLCFFTVALLPTVWLLYYIPLIFQFPMAGNIWQELLFVVPMILACISIGMCLQGIIWQREGIFVIWVLTSVMFLFLSGITWPRFAMPTVWHALGDCIPSTWGIEGFVRMNTNGATLAQAGSEYTMLWVLAAVYTAAAYCIQRWIVASDLRRRILLAR